MNEKKPSTFRQKAEHQIRCGVVTASIYIRQSNCGFPYFDFSLTRSWKSVTTGKEAHGSSFFDCNEQDLVEAVQRACEWIRGKAEPTTPAGPPAVEKKHAP